MDLIQKAATIALLTLLSYFVMVNILDRKKEEVPLSTAGKLNKGCEHTTADPSVDMISNKLDLEANKNAPVVGINTDVGYHSRTTVGEPVSPGGENVTQLSVFNDQAKGILPVNHDLFEKRANFGSDVTNINQFYRDNPEVFDRTMTSAPNAVEWNTHSQDMFNKLTHEEPNTTISAWNFEKDPLT